MQARALRSIFTHEAAVSFSVGVFLSGLSTSNPARPPLKAAYKTNKHAGRMQKQLQAMVRTTNRCNSREKQQKHYKLWRAEHSEHNTSRSRTMAAGKDSVLAASSSGLGQVPVPAHPTPSPSPPPTSPCTPLETGSRHHCHLFPCKRPGNGSSHFLPPPGPASPGSARKGGDPTFFLQALWHHPLPSCITTKCIARL